MKKNNNDFNENELISKMNNCFSNTENKKVNIDKVFDDAVDNSFFGRLVKLKRKHEEVKNEYAKIFCERMGLEDDWAYFSGSIFCVCDYFIDINTIMWAVENLIDEDMFFGWYDYNLFLGELELGEISLEDYCKGKHKFSNDEINSLRIARNKILETKRNFDNLLLEIQSKHKNS